MTGIGAGFATGPRDAITDVAGIRVGHWTNRRAGTGCTVIRCERGMMAAVDVRGGAPGTRETDALGTEQVVRACHAVLLTGGSAFGLAAADGVMRWLAEHDAGFGTVHRKVPIVPSAVLYDLGLGRADITPDAAAGYQAAVAATGGRVAQGSVGAGTGATIAKLLGAERMLKGGIGTASVAGPKGLIAGAIVANNGMGHMVDPARGCVIAGPRGDTPGQFIDLATALDLRTLTMDALLQNTTLVCVATNAAIQHHELQRVAYLAHDGLARVVQPAHTVGDGDVAFALTTAAVPVQPYDVLTVGVLAALAVERALVASVRCATTLHGVPGATEWRAKRASEPVPAGQE
ncbi:hypothetical protein AYO38_09345 [bacterium SCGC AG-212-C10]|nr:hypothetical protein AYO38_09345 [bacterium SCGC AG-212-C10]